GEFSDLRAWLAYAGSKEASGACISRYFSPEDLGGTNLNVQDEYTAASAIFTPLFERVYSNAPAEAPPQSTDTKSQHVLPLAANGGSSPLPKADDSPGPPAYTIEDALNGLFLPREQL